MDGMKSSRQRTGTGLVYRMCFLFQAWSAGLVGLCEMVRYDMGESCGMVYRKWGEWPETRALLQGKRDGNAGCGI